MKQVDGLGCDESLEGLDGERFKILPGEGGPPDDGLERLAVE